MIVLGRNTDGTPNAVELTEVEMALSELHSLLLDQGYSQSDALILMRGSLIDPDLRTKSPVLDATLTPEFCDWLST